MSVPGTRVLSRVSGQSRDKTCTVIFFFIIFFEIINLNENVSLIFFFLDFVVVVMLTHLPSFTI